MKFRTKIQKYKNETSAVNSFMNYCILEGDLSYQRETLYEKNDFSKY